MRDCPSKADLPVAQGASPDSEILVRIFNALFAGSENTVLVRGDDEPVYLPADGTDTRNRVVFAHGFFASALHEIAHWCIAGSARRKLVDFGYWYRPDGRSAEEQHSFELVEVKPQALEWIFSRAAGVPFRVSLDNLSGQASGSEQVFCERVVAQTAHYLNNGLPDRAARFTAALQASFRPHDRLDAADFRLAHIWRPTEDFGQGAETERELGKT